MGHSLFEDHPVLRSAGPSSGDSVHKPDTKRQPNSQ
jgi:hypothetical protein